jgi:phosphatidylinositol kinase/protein kinase (PI-3  family)
MQGRTFDVSEKVPFRLTQNIVDALGVSGVEGALNPVFSALPTSSESS